MPGGSSIRAPLLAQPSDAQRQHSDVRLRSRSMFDSSRHSQAANAAEWTCAIVLKSTAAMSKKPTVKLSSRLKELSRCFSGTRSHQIQFEHEVDGTSPAESRFADRGLGRSAKKDPEGNLVSPETFHTAATAALVKRLKGAGLQTELTSSLRAQSDAEGSVQVPC